MVTSMVFCKCSVVVMVFGAQKETPKSDSQQEELHELMPKLIVQLGYPWALRLQVFLVQLTQGVKHSLPPLSGSNSCRDSPNCLQESPRRAAEIFVNRCLIVAKIVIVV
mmetsp:Transcript_3954/g.5755  ORF Transcript_3954/g.5755 Transcript_3954/m.5755 type:complete len:109 (+) Transcript_3954:207-533(+)